MVGYPHIDKIVYDVFDKVMGQVEGGSLVVQKGREGKPRTTTSIQTRDLNICEGLDEAIKLAKVYSPSILNLPRQMSQNPLNHPLMNLPIPIYQFIYLIFIFLFNLPFIIFHHRVHHLLHRRQLLYPLQITSLHTYCTFWIQCTIWNLALFHKDSP